MSTKADYIITLIGKNPSPNYYTILNYSKKDTKVYGFYTVNDGRAVSSKKILENIDNSIKEKDNSISIKYIPCDKSKIKNIEKCIKHEFKDIIKDCDYDNLGSRKVNIIVDYTGATKAMSALFYSFYNGIVESGKYKKINIHSSYISSDRGVIYECEFQSVKNKFTYNIENIFSKFNITKEDLIKIHGYKIDNENEESISISKNQLDSCFHPYKFNSINIKKENLIFSITVKCEKIKQLVDKYFEISDEVEKVGGSESYIDFHIEGYKFEKKIKDYQEARCRFYDSLSNVYSRDLRDKVTIKFEGEKKEEDE
jgi:hypothetical protein